MDEPTCSEDGCRKLTETDGRCQPHYRRDYLRRKQAGTVVPHVTANPESKCSVPGDDHSPGDRLTDGMCGRHYQRLQRNGDPLIKRSRYGGVTPEARFLAKVNRNGPLPEQRPELGPCWVWTSSKQGSGYGSFGLGGSNIGAHVASYILFRAPVPEGMEIDHLCHPWDGSCQRATCRHRLCVNPDHLDPVTRAENVRRGSSIFGQNMRKTHCHRGHELTPESTYIKIMPSGRESRQCHECRRLRSGFQGEAGAPIAPPNTTKTHCPKGHPYSKENTYVTPKGQRQCRICKREAYLAWQERQKG